ncbi:MAG: extracellular solute-binding protein [Chthoniobacterales bacterium]
MNSTIDKNLPTPLYFQLGQLLKRRIALQGFQIGDRFPTASELCKEYDVSMITARKAMQDLAREGIIKSARGQGSVVIKQLRLPTEIKEKSNQRLRITLIPPLSELCSCPEFKALLKETFPDLTLDVIFKSDNHEATKEFSDADVVMMTDYDFQELKEKKAIRSFSELGCEEQVAEVRKNFLPEIERITGSEALEYSLPLTCTPMVLFYNRSLIHQADIVEETAFSTVSQLVNTSRKLRKSFEIHEIRGTAPLLIELSKYRRWPLAIYWNKGRVWSKDGRESLIDSDVAIKSIQWYRDIVENQRIAINVFEGGIALESELFRNGKVAMHFGSYPYLRAYETIETFEIGIVPVPKGETSATLSVQALIGVGANAENPELAMKFIQFMASEAVQYLILKKRLHIPTCQKAVDRWLQNDAKPHQRYHLQVFLNALNTVVENEYPRDRTRQDYLNHAMNSLLLDLKSAETICHQIADTIRKNKF